MGPSQINALRIANVLLGVLPVLIDTSWFPPSLFDIVWDGKIGYLFA